MKDEIETLSGTTADSFLRNSFIHGRGGDADEGPLFVQREGTGDIVCRLDGYAVVPKEEYQRLKAAAGEPIDI